MKLYNIYNEVILEAVSNFKTWISGENNIAKSVSDMLDKDSGGKYYYVKFTYPNDENIGGDSDRWAIITQYGKSKDDKLTIRALEVNNDGTSETGKAKTYNINKIKKMLISKVPVFDVPEEFKTLYGDVANDKSANNPFKELYATADFGSYQYAASTLKNKERAAAKAAKQTTQEPVQTTQEPVKPIEKEPVVEPLQVTKEPVEEPQQTQMTEPLEVEPETITTPDDEENENNNDELKK